MRLSERYEIPAPIGSVGPLFEDVLLIVPHVPGAEVASGTGEGPFEGGISVAFGPRVIKLRGAFRYRFDPETRTGRLEGSGSDARGNSRATGHADFELSSADEVNTVVRVGVELTLTGPLAMVAETGAPHVARAIFAEFSRSLVAELPAPGEGDGAVPGHGEAVTGSGSASAGAAPVNGLRLVWSVLVRLVWGFFGKVGRVLLWRTSRDGNGA